MLIVQQPQPVLNRANRRGRKPSLVVSEVISIVIYFHMSRYRDFKAMRQQAIRLYLDGNNQRRIARQLGISQGSVANWTREFANSLPDEVPQPEQAVEVAEIDELFTFVAHKKTTLTS